MDLDDAPRDSDGSYASPVMPHASVEQHSVIADFIPTEILMDDTTIQIIQSIPDPESCSIGQESYPEHSVPGHLMSVKPKVMTIEDPRTPQSHYSVHSEIESSCNQMPFIPFGGIKFDSISYHLHPHTSQSAFCPFTHNPPSVHECIGSSRASPLQKSFVSSHSSPSVEPLPNEISSNQSNSLHETEPTISTVVHSVSQPNSSFIAQSGQREGKPWTTKGAHSSKKGWYPIDFYVRNCVTPDIAITIGKFYLREIKLILLNQL